MLKFEEKPIPGPFGAEGYGVRHVATLTLGAFVWTFRIEELDDCCELHVCP